MPHWMATEADRAEAASVLLGGLAKQATVAEIVDARAPLHRKHNTFPGEVFLDVGGDALDLAGVTREEPVPGEVLERYLPECSFRGRDNHKVGYAVLATAPRRGGVDVDLLDEVAWWRTDDFWYYARCAAIALIRAAADRSGESAAQFATRLNDRGRLATGS